MKLFYFWCTKSKSPAITLPTYIGPDDSQIKFMRKSNNYARLIYPNIFPVTDSHSIRSQTKQKKFQARKIHINKRSKPKQNGSAKSLWINRTQIFAFLVTLPFLSVKYTLSHEEKLSGFNWNYLLCKHKIYYQSLFKKKDFWKRASLAGWALLRYCVSLCVSQDLWVLNYWMWIVANARLGKIMVFNWHIPLP